MHVGSITAAEALVDAVLGDTAAVALVLAVFAVVTADVLAVVALEVATSKSASCTAKLFWVKLSFRSSALIAEPGKKRCLKGINIRISKDTNSNPIGRCSSKT